MDSSSGGAAHPGPATVNYDEEALVQLVIDDLEYRVDAGKQGTALCVSTREPGSWDWSFFDEVRFDGRDVRSKTLERSVRNTLALALREVAQSFSND